MDADTDDGLHTNGKATRASNYGLDPDKFGTAKYVRGAYIIMYGEQNVRIYTSVQ